MIGRAHNEGRKLFPPEKGWGPLFVVAVKVVPDAPTQPVQ